MMDVRSKFLILEKFDANTPATELCEKLREIIDDIWKYGLTNDHFSTLIEIFILNKSLEGTQRQLILECLIPQFVIDSSTLEQILLWFFSTYITDPESSAHVLSWLAALLEHKLLDTSTLKPYYYQLASSFQAECLVKPLCRVLQLLTNEKTITKSVVFLIQEFYDNFRSVELKNLLWEIKQYSPHLVHINFNTKPRIVHKISNFERAVAKVVRKSGILHQQSNFQADTKIAGGRFIPEPEYERNYEFKKITDIMSCTNLGSSMCDLSLALPTNPVTLLGNKMGMIYLGLVGPNEQFLSSLQVLLESRPPLEVIARISELQCRLRHGFPVVTLYLGRFLITWDGLDSQSVVYDLISWVHFDSYDELYSTILVPLTRLYICSNVETKVHIILAIKNLIINMVSVHMERLQQVQNKFDGIFEKPKWLDDSIKTFMNVCTYVQSLITVGLMLEGLDNSTFLLESLSFYHTIVSLQLEFSLICIVLPIPAVIYSAFTSMNHTVLSQTGSLILRYKQKVLPLLDRLGVIEAFSVEIQLINEMSDKMFTYFWKDLEETWDRSVTNRSSNSSTEKLKRHPALNPLIQFLAKKLRVNQDKLTKEDIVLMLVNYCEGLGKFIQCYLTEDYRHRI